MELKPYSADADKVDRCRPVGRSLRLHHPIPVQDILQPCAGVLVESSVNRAGTTLC